MSFVYFKRHKSYPIVVFQVNKERHFVNERYLVFFALSFSKTNLARPVGSENTKYLNARLFT